MKIVLTVFVYFFLVPLFFAQTTFTSTIKNCSLYKLFNQPNGDIIAYGRYGSSKSIIAKFNSLGTQKWQVILPKSLDVGPFVFSDGTIIGYSITYDKTKTYSCSINGELTADSSNGSPFWARSVYFCNDKLFFVTPKKFSSTNSTYIIERYNRHATKEYSFSFEGAINSGYYLNVTDSFIVACSYSNAPTQLVFGWDGKLVFAKDFFAIRNNTFTVSNNIFFRTNKELICIDSKGRTIFKYGLDSTSVISNIVKYKSNSFLLCGKKYSAINDKGNLLWEKQPFKFTIDTTPIYTNDDGFIFAYSNFLFKVDSTFYVELLGALAISESNIYPLKFASISWVSTYNELGTLEYSFDDGVNWHFIANVNLSDNNFRWFVPREFTNQCKLRLTSNLNSSRQTESPLQKFLSYGDGNNLLGINNLRYTHLTNGKGKGLLITDNSNNASTVPLISGDGVNWIGVSNGELKFGGTHYKTGLVPGNITKTNTRANPSDARMRSWNYYKDWKSLQEGEAKENYKYDLFNWPIDLGAPWKDLNGDGKYNPELGETPWPNADELHWMVMNDLDTANCKSQMLNSNPLGLEVQLSIYGYENKYPGVVFKRYLLINKSNSEISNMYISNWSDDDLGGWSSVDNKFITDFNVVGSDSSLNLAYTYNNKNSLISADALSSIGHMTLQGPIIKGNTDDKAIFKSSIRAGYKNLNANSIVFNSRHDDRFPGRYEYLSSPTEILNIFKGLNTKGAAIINPETNKPSTFCFSGNPETNSGWIFIPYVNVKDSDDACYAVTTGPFNMAIQDTQEVVVAILYAKGKTPLNAATEMKKLAKKIKDDYYSGGFNSNSVYNNILPMNFSLSQNYPNPFNPETTISYSIPKSEHVTLRVFDLIGQEVATLVDEYKNAGTYNSKFSIINYKLVSGVYFYRLQAGSFSQTKKLILMK